MTQKLATIINLYGGPGTGKSTTAAGLFHFMKLAGYNCEYVNEFAKDKVWEENSTVFENQFYITAKQQYKIYRASKHVDYVITDSPILLAHAYSESEHLKALAEEEYAKYININVMLKRVKKYNPIGRHQSEEQARSLDKKIADIISTVPLFAGVRTINLEVTADNKAPEKIMEALDLK